MQFNYQVTMGSLTARYYEQVKDYLHPHIHQFINYYRCGDVIDLPLYHGFNRLNRNKTRKEIVCRISIKDGFNTDLKTSELMLGKYDKEVYQSCRYCHQVI